MDVQDARRELGKWLNEEPRKPVDRVALATVLAALDASLDGEAEPVAWPIDREWLWAVLRYARKNPSAFPDVDYAGGKVPIDEESADAIIAAMNAPPADSAQGLVEAPEKYRGQIANDGRSGYAEDAIDAWRRQHGQE